MGKPEELGMTVEAREKLKEKLASMRDTAVRTQTMEHTQFCGGETVMTTTILSILDVLDVIVARLP